MGGTLVTLLASFLMEGWMGILTKTDWLILAGIVSVFGVYGDLVESFIKRHFDKKDSGSLIPGHGGVLDRIDSILLVMPAAYIYMKLNGL
jgi:phosphatidate cytidylyltransferase